MLTKSEGKEVSLVIEREGRELEVQVTPAVVDSSVIAYEENGYGYLQLSSFSENSGADVESALKRFVQAG